MVDFPEVEPPHFHPAQSPALRIRLAWLADCCERNDLPGGRWFR